MADARHFCPECGGIDLVIEDKLLVHVRPESELGHSAKCPNCGWEGKLANTIGAVSSQAFWDIERVSGVLVRVVAEHAAGPFVQVMEFVGLIPRRLSLEEYKASLPDKGASKQEYELQAAVRRHNQIVIDSREIVVKAMLEGALTKGFEAAELCHRRWAVETNSPLHSMLQQNPEHDRGEFGGD